ncbi:AraC family transcriptional regulator [Chelatococcus reniformis]|uniref:HTH araC/xylS-type domain-containing protein n=1 Tax=Chelatococcus reniformis TaxID=1494448 RepID=A0A916UQT5_9HYPH|nr:AraC family transcriptional regulator [Chelatococcus reniformis]GGC83325.1 hypothetical protein GCM10010994_46510 [Chelatococcus reniformis]
MVRIANHRFSDPYRYAATLRAAHVRGVIAEKGDFAAELLQVDLDKLWMQAGSESLARCAHIRLTPDRVPIFFLQGPGEPAVQTGGVDLEPGMLVVWAPGSAHWQRTEAATRWGTLSLAPQDLLAAGRAIAGRDIVVPREASVLRPNATAMGRLTSLHADVRLLARQAPQRLAHHEVARALDNALTAAIVECMVEAVSVAPAFSFRQHAAVMKRLEDMIHRNADRSLYLSEVCKAVGASERTLRRCCQEQLGMAPNQYLLLRRLHLARQRLLESDHRTTSVTEIATGLGFWELGRFSGAYHGAFGELPRATLARTPAASAARYVRHVWP